MPPRLLVARLRRAKTGNLCALVVSLGLAAGLGSSPSQAEAFSVNYCNTVVNPGTYCNHGNYNSIIYNRANASWYVGNNCVAMVTAAGNYRGGGWFCDVDRDAQARMCVSSATPMSEGRVTTLSAGDYQAAVVNNITYDSGCAV